MLEFSTKVVRQKIKIDDAEYELRGSAEVTVEMMVLITRVAVMLQKTQSGREVVVADYEAALNKAVSWIIVDVPPPVVKKLSGQHKVEIYNYFFTPSLSPARMKALLAEHGLA